MPTDQVDQVVQRLKDYGARNIIAISGVAGTGKTHYALQAAVKFCGSPLFVKQIQFHTSYSYEDLIEGLRPNTNGGFDLVNGSLTDWNDQAQKDPDNRYVYLIEELTRANVSSVLGELFTFIEYRDRTFQLPISKRQMQLASNLAILATMNPQDRSALELDDALLRRLRIFQFAPSIEELTKILTFSLEGTAVEESGRITNGLTHLFQTCKERYPDSFEDSMPFGHAVFSHIKSENDLRRLWHEQLKFLLQRNQNVPAHPFADLIRELYIWK